MATWEYSWVSGDDVTFSNEQSADALVAVFGTAVTIKDARHLHIKGVFRGMGWVDVAGCLGRLGWELAAFAPINMNFSPAFMFKRPLSEPPVIRNS
jgi:hypothetical protein